MGGLKSKIANGIKMFKPKSLKNSISLPCMRDEQLTQQKKVTCPLINLPNSSPKKGKATTPVKRLTWEEMQTLL